MQAAGPSLAVLDGVEISDGERRKAQELLEQLAEKDKRKQAVGAKRASTAGRGRDGLGIGR
jgi:hypothetical protein